MPENEFYWRKNHLPIFQTHVSACCSALATLQRYRPLRSFEKGTTGTLGGVPMSHGSSMPFWLWMSFILSK